MRSLLVCSVAGLLIVAKENEKGDEDEAEITFVAVITLLTGGAQTMVPPLQLEKERAGPERELRQTAGKDIRM